MACWITGITTGTLNNGPGLVLQSSATDWVSIAKGSIYTLAQKPMAPYGAGAMTPKGNWVTQNSGSYSNPVLIDPNQQWNAIFAYAYSSFAIRSDGTLWAWETMQIRYRGWGGINKFERRLGSYSGRKRIQLGQSGDFPRSLFRWHSIRRLALGLGQHRPPFLRAVRIRQYKRDHSDCKRSSAGRNQWTLDGRDHPSHPRWHRGFESRRQPVGYTDPRPKQRLWLG